MTGQRIITKIADEDTDDDGTRRVIPIGTAGTVNSVSHTDQDGVTYYNIFWDNGAWTIWSTAEIARDAEAAP